MICIFINRNREISADRQIKQTDIWHPESYLMWFIDLIKMYSQTKYSQCIWLFPGLKTANLILFVWVCIYRYGCVYVCFMGAFIGMWVLMGMRGCMSMYIFIHMYTQKIPSMIISYNSTRNKIAFSIFPIDFLHVVYD